MRYSLNCLRNDYLPNFALKFNLTNATLSAFGLLVAIALPALTPAKADVSQTERPNFLVILADDLGWADLGVMGSQIRTPNLDALAARGMLMSNFYVAPTCAPTRAMLLTGLSSHEAGLGTQHQQQAESQKGAIAYGGQLHDGVVTLSEALGDSGYQTMISGKWHIGHDDTQAPHRRGFQRSFILREGGASHFEDMLEINPVELPFYFEDGQPVEKLPAGFYSTTNYTDKMLEFLDQRDRSKPFFSYLAYTAPHDPLQVPDDWLEAYRGVFDAGPEAVRARRMVALRDKGLFPEGADIPPPLALPPLVPGRKKPWSERSSEERRIDARPVEIYAAMVEILDLNIGRVLDYLATQGELDNTYVIFMSDNGASAVTPLNYPGTSREWLHTERKMDPSDAGRMGSHTFISAEWAAVLNGPNRLFKAMITEGGIRTPLIIAGPRVPAGRIAHAPGHVSDIAPSLYQLANIDAATLPLYADKPKPRGISLVPLWQGAQNAPRPPIVMELFGNMMVRDGDWKLLRLLPPFSTGDPELFDLKSDPGETIDLVETHPEIATRLLADYDKFAEQVGVIAPAPPLERSIRGVYVGKCGWDCEARFLLIEILIHSVGRWVFLALVLGFVASIVGFGIRLVRRRRQVIAIGGDAR